jgi:hypothetical protein
LNFGNLNDDNGGGDGGGGGGDGGDDSNKYFKSVTLTYMHTIFILVILILTRIKL